MHPFSDVRKDAGGFYIMREDNPDGWRMRPGDLVQDVALNQMPYWQVVTNDQERIDLEPIGPNPLLTGVGAGGYVFRAEDFKVLTGEYEQERIAKLTELLESGEPVQIYDVKYLLLGTVPLNFGPNGPQGGWYNPSDTYSNRGRGTSPEQVVVKDARTLQRMGFDIPEAALAGEISPHLWGQFVEGPAGMFSDWLEVEPEDLELLIENYLAAPWLADSPRDPADIAEYLRKRRPPTEAWELFALPEEDEWTLEETMQHPQEEVQMRGVSRACMSAMSSTSDEGRRALRAFLASGAGSVGVYDRALEAIGHYFPDAVPLLLLGTRLLNGYSRYRAYQGLALQRYPKLADFAFKETDAEALKAIANGLLEHGYMPGRAVVQHLLVEFARMLEGGSVYNRFYAADGIKNLLRLAAKQKIDTRDVERQLDAYEERVRKNPPDHPTRREDIAWLEAVF
jgi:hypothetical protein